MLTIDPAKRVTLEQVKQDKWINEGCDSALGPPEAGQIHISESEHEAVLHEMETLGIDRETAIQSVRENGYDHIAATYYLLCDKIFKRKPLEGGEFDHSSAVSAKPPQTQSHAEVKDIGEESDDAESDDEGTFFFFFVDRPVVHVLPQNLTFPPSPQLLHHQTIRAGS
jgi:hypothetical protein